MFTVFEITVQQFTFLQEFRGSSTISLQFE